MAPPPGVSMISAFRDLTDGAWLTETMPLVAALVQIDNGGQAETDYIAIDGARLDRHSALLLGDGRVVDPGGASHADVGGWLDSLEG